MGSANRRGRQEKLKANEGNNYAIQQLCKMEQMNEDGSRNNKSNCCT